MNATADENALESLVAPHLGAQGGLLSALIAVQNAMGCIPAVAVPVIADLFNLTKAEIRGVISFYEDLTTEPKGKHVIRICQAEACQAVGSRDLTARAVKALGVELGATTADGLITVEAVYCLGLCASGPALMADGQLFGRMDREGALDDVMKVLGRSS